MLVVYFGKTKQIVKLTYKDNIYLIKTEQYHYFTTTMCNYIIHWSKMFCIQAGVTLIAPNTGKYFKCK